MFRVFGFCPHGRPCVSRREVSCVHLLTCPCVVVCCSQLPGLNKIAPEFYHPTKLEYLFSQYHVIGRDQETLIFFNLL